MIENIKVKALLADIMVVNSPNVVTISTITLAEMQVLAGIIMAVTSAVCTLLLTWNTLRRKDKP